MTESYQSHHSHGAALHYTALHPSSSSTICDRKGTCPPRHVPPSSTHCLLCCMLDVLQKHACFLKYRKEKKKKKEDTLKPSSPCQTIALFTQVLLLIPSEFHTGIFVSYCCRRPTIDHNNSLFGTHKLVSFLKHNSNCSSENITGY